MMKKFPNVLFFSDKFKQNQVPPITFKVFKDSYKEPEPEVDVDFIEHVEGHLITNEFEHMGKGEFLDNYKINQLQLSPLEARFVEAYCENYNGTEAAIQAGYTNKRASAAVQSSRLLKKEYIQTAVSMRPTFLAYTQNIPTKEGIRQRLFRIMDNELIPEMVQLKAIDMLAKLDFHYEKEQVKQDTQVEILITTSEEVQRIQQEEHQKMLETTTEQVL